MDELEAIAIRSGFALLNHALALPLLVFPEVGQERKERIQERAAYEAPGSGNNYPMQLY